MTVAAAVAGPTRAQEGIAGAVSPKSQEPDNQPAAQTMQPVGGAPQDATARPPSYKLVKKEPPRSCTQHILKSKVNGAVRTRVTRTCKTAAPKPRG